MISHEHVQAAVSARIDGEPSGLDDDLVDAHLQACGECRTYRDRVASLSRTLNFVEPVDDGMSPPADLSDAILAGVEHEWRRHSAALRTRVAVGRVALVLAAIAHLAWAVSVVASAGGLAPVGAEGTLAPHAQPEMGTALVHVAGIHCALAVGLGLSAWAPRLIAGFLVVPATLMGFTLGFAVRDVIVAEVTLTHLAQLFLLVATVLTLVMTWLASEGVTVRGVWRLLGAQPTTA